MFFFRLSPLAQSNVLKVFCELLDPSRADSARGDWKLSKLLEKFALSYLHEYQCDSCCTDSGPSKRVDK